MYRYITSRHIYIDTLLAYTCIYTLLTDTFLNVLQCCIGIKCFYKRNQLKLGSTYIHNLERTIAVSANR